MEIDRIAEAMRVAAIRLDTAFCISDPPHDLRFAAARDELRQARKDLLAMRFSVPSIV